MNINELLDSKTTDYVTKPYKDYIENQTKKYQKIYGFEIGEGKDATWNNESDAFKHTFMSADMALKTYAGLSKRIGDMHEEKGNRTLGQSPDQENMDKWNNQQGRQIAQKIAKEIGNPIKVKIKSLNGELEDIIAKEVVHKMRKCALITHPDNKRKYTESKTPTQKLNDEIRARYKQMQEKSNKKLQQIFQKNSKSSKSTSANSGTGRWVTINGHHVFIS